MKRETLEPVHIETSPEKKKINFYESKNNIENEY